MDEFSFLAVLLSVILGLAITQILQGFRGLLLSRTRIQTCSGLFRAERAANVPRFSPVSVEGADRLDPAEMAFRDFRFVATRIPRSGALGLTAAVRNATRRPSLGTARGAETPR